MRVFRSLFRVRGEVLSSFLSLIASVTRLLQDSYYEVQVAFCAIALMDPVFRLLLCNLRGDSPSVNLACPGPDHVLFRTDL